MKITIQAYCVFRKYYGYLCHDGLNMDDLGWYFQIDIPKKGVSLVWFKTKAEADCWRNRLPITKKGWFGQCATETKPVKLTMEMGVDASWE